MQKVVFIFLASLALFLMAGCSSANSDPAGQAAQTYFQALADKNENAMVAASCAAWEEQARLDLSAFSGVKTQSNAIACQTEESGEGTAVVSCTGSIQATYGSENQEFGLDGRLYQVIQEGGEWRMCGYQP